MSRTGMLVGVLLAGTLIFCAGVQAGAGQGTGSGPAGRESPAAAGLRTGWTARRCFLPPAAAADRDGDHVDDACEHELAAAFAPELVFDERDCGWDRSVAGGLVGGGYLYAVQREPGSGRARIAYLPAYFQDCGWRLPACRLTWWLCDGHAGDSELVVVDAANDPVSRRWTTERVFLSAHCFGRSDGRCRWLAGRGLRSIQWLDGVRQGAPVVWVALGKHGNYPSRGACGSGHWSYDGCDGNRARRRFPVLSPRQNAGSRERPFPFGDGRECIGAAALVVAPRRVSGAVECFWDPDARFRGWTAERGGGSATGYGRYLLDVAGF